MGACKWPIEGQTREERGMEVWKRRNKNWHSNRGRERERQNKAKKKKKQAIRAQL